MATRYSKVVRRSSDLMKKQPTSSEPANEYKMLQSFGRKLSTLLLPKPPLIRRLFLFSLFYSLQRCYTITIWKTHNRKKDRSKRQWKRQTAEYAKASRNSVATFETR